MCRHGAAAGASGAVDTAGDAITAESAPIFAEPAGDEQGRRKLQTTISDCHDAIRRNCDENQLQKIRLLIHQPRGSDVKTGSV
ncbi:unnamed protein product [Closterium sp. NIES-65]|nr:unnamed protein product [Closterium sp. NIES-65]